MEDHDEHATIEQAQEHFLWVNVYYYEIYGYRSQHATVSQSQTPEKTLKSFS